MYSPSIRRFKRVPLMNATLKSSNANLPDVNDKDLTDDSEYSDWNGLFSDSGSPKDALISSSSLSEKQERENSLLESSQSFVDANEDSVDIDNASESLFELPLDLLIDEQNTRWFDDEEHDALSKPKRGKKRNAIFASQSSGQLQHPYLKWELNEASMNKYMPEYAKQEGFAVNREKEHKGRIIRWRCIYAGKYKNHRNLSAEVGRQDISLNYGASLGFVTKNSTESTSATETWSQLQSWLFFLRNFYRSSRQFIQISM